YHLGEAACRILHELVREQQGEWLAADKLARTPDRVTEAERLLLAGDAGRPGLRQILREQVEVGTFLSLPQGHFQLELAVEMVLDHALVAAGDENEMLDAGLARLVDDVLDQRPVDHRQHFLGHGFGGGEEAGAEPGNGKNGFSNRCHGWDRIVAGIRRERRRKTGTLDWRR